MTLEGVTDLKWPDTNNYQPEGHFKSLTHAKVMLLLISLDIVNLKTKIVIIVGFWSSFLIKMHLLFKVIHMQFTVLSLICIIKDIAI